jgi:anti-anti-sigma factor
MECIEEKQESVMVLGLRGRMDSSTSRIVEEKLLGLVDRGENQLVVDCAQLDYISSAGLRVFLMAAKRLTQAKGKLVVATLNDDVKQVFDLTGFSSIFQICGSKEEAITSYQHGQH